MQPCLFSRQLFFRLNIIRIRNAAIYGTNCRTLRLLMETGAFGTLAVHYIIELIGYGSLCSLGIDAGSIFKLYLCKLRATGPVPFPATFINSSVGALGFTSSAVDTLFSNLDCHLY